MQLLLILLALASCVLTIDWSQVQTVIESGINQGIFYGGVLAVASHNSTIFKKAYGTTLPRRGFYAPPMQINYKFDLNRLTQVVGTNTVLMQLYDQGSANISRRVSYILKDFNNNNKLFITIQNMLQHNSGFPAQFKNPFPATPTELLKNIEQLKLQYTTESKFLYSEIGYTVLGHLVQQLTNKTLNNALHDLLIFAGMRDTGYLPSSNQSQIVPGGYNQGICRGIPANKYARFLNGMAGNAGLFSTVDNLVSFMQLMLNKGKMPSASRIFSEDVVNLYTTAASEKKYKNTFAKGWETVPATNPSCGKKFSKNSFGLADTSGSYLWADKDKNVTIVFLANGNFPAERNVPTDFQGRLSDAIMTALGY